jgi:hypothetical protein
MLKKVAAQAPAPRMVSCQLWRVRVVCLTLWGDRTFFNLPHRRFAQCCAVLSACSQSCSQAYVFTSTADGKGEENGERRVQGKWREE